MLGFLAEILPGEADFRGSNYFKEIQRSEAEFSPKDGRLGLVSQAPGRGFYYVR